MLDPVKKKAKKKPRSSQKRTGSKTINLKKYFGKVDFGTDGLTFQKKMRANE